MTCDSRSIQIDHFLSDQSIRDSVDALEMSAYQGRTGPNFSQYLTDLNTLSPPDQPFIEDDTFSNDLAMFTNTDFTNIDIPGYGDDGYNFDMSPEAQGQESLKYEELLSGTVPPAGYQSLPRLDTAVQPQQFYSAFSTPIQPAPISGYATAGPLRQDTTSRDTKRTRTETVEPVEILDTDDKSRVAADEDKRRRNTAASARFRVKKKQREQALERTLKDTNEKNAKLEARISQLELENKWLKELITEKNGLQSKEEMAAAYEQHRIESEERDLKQEPGHTSGVGTAS